MKFLIFTFAAVCLTAVPNLVSAATMNEGTINPQDLVADQQATFNAFSNIRKLSKDITLWSKTTNKAIDNHFYHDTTQNRILHRSDSPIVFSHLTHGKLIGEAFLSVKKQIILLNSKAEILALHANQARLNAHDLFQTKCYCEEFKKGWFYPPEVVIDWFIDLGRNQTGMYLSAIHCADEFFVHLEKLEDSVWRLDEMISLEQEFQNMDGPVAVHNAIRKPTEEAKSALKKIKNLRRQMGKAFKAKLDVTRLESARELVATRAENLTILAEMDASFNRALASIDLACVMARKDKSASVLHMVTYGSAKVGFCPVTE